MFDRVKPSHMEPSTLGCCAQCTGQQNQRQEFPIYVIYPRVNVDSLLPERNVFSLVFLDREAHVCVSPAHHVRRTYFLFLTSSTTFCIVKHW